MAARRGRWPGRTVAVTRARAQASGLARSLRELGAAAVEAPAIRIEPIDGAAPDLSRLRPRLPDEPERRPVAVRAAARATAATRGRWPALGRGDRAGHGRGR